MYEIIIEIFLLFIFFSDAKQEKKNENIQIV